MHDFETARYGGLFCSFWGFCGMGVLEGFGVGLASFLGGLINYVLSIWFLAPPSNDIGIAFGFWGSLE